MRRTAALIALATALLAPSGALSSVEGYSAPTKRGFDIKFRAFFKNGKPDVIKKFQFDNVVVDCTLGGSFSTSSEPPHFGPMDVNGQGKFGRSFAANQDGARVVIHGDYKTNHKIKGTLRINGDYPGYTNCRSGTLEWAATIN
jgi:hypothetical protein